MFGKNIERKVKKTIEEFDDWDVSETLDGTVLDFIDYIVEIIKARRGMSTTDALDYLMSDEMRYEFLMYIDEYSDLVDNF